MKYEPICLPRLKAWPFNDLRVDLISGQNEIITTPNVMRPGRAYGKRREFDAFFYSRMQKVF